MAETSSRSEVEQAARLIRAGRLVAFPTETVYGLGANALNREAVARIYAAKARPATSPLILHVASPEMARQLVSDWPQAAEPLASRYWPGPLTLVLPKHPRIPDIVTAGLGTVGIRMPAHPLALELIRAAGVPIAAPSANRFSQLSPTTADHVRAALGAAVDLVLDGGPTTVGIESTVLSLADEPARLLRPGQVSRAEIEDLIGPVEVCGRIEDGSPNPAPGMRARHYSPTTPLVLVAGPELPASGHGAYLRLGRPARRPNAVEMPMPPDPSAYAAVLYATLHRLDSEGYDWIAVERPPDEPEWAAVLDRLERAASR